MSITSITNNKYTNKKYKNAKLIEKRRRISVSHLVSITFLIIPVKSTGNMFILLTGLSFENALYNKSSLALREKFAKNYVFKYERAVSPRLRNWLENAFSTDTSLLQKVKLDGGGNVFLLGGQVMCSLQKSPFYAPSLSIACKTYPNQSFFAFRCSFDLIEDPRAHLAEARCILNFVVWETQNGKYLTSVCILFWIHTFSQRPISSKAQTTHLSRLGWSLIIFASPSILQCGAFCFVRFSDSLETFLCYFDWIWWVVGWGTWLHSATHGLQSVS